MTGFSRSPDPRRWSSRCLRSGRRRGSMPSSASSTRPRSRNSAFRPSRPPGSSMRQASRASRRSTCRSCLSIETLDVSSADVVISSHHTAAKGVLTSPEQLHRYCYSPLRAAWDLREDYLSRLPAPLRPFGRYALHRLRRSEVQASFGVDRFHRHLPLRRAADQQILPARGDGRSSARRIGRLFGQLREGRSFSASAGSCATSRPA